MPRCGLRDDQWARIAGRLPGKDGDRGRSAKDNRRLVDAVLCIARTGAPWRDLPPGFGPWNSVDVRFRRWAQNGVWEQVLEVLHDDLAREYLGMDSTVVRAHQHAAGAKNASANQALGRSRGGPSRKLHLRVDALGQRIRVVLTPGQAHDATQAEALLDGQQAGHVIADGIADVIADVIADGIADKAYDADRIRAAIGARNAKAVSPPHPTRASVIAYDQHLDKERHLVECFINKLKHVRRIATRYDKT
ncbi:MAG: IS5 family transposase, partial [Geminicoccales bacterium]